MDIDVEYRPEYEVTHLDGKLITTENTRALYPAFDVTPNEMINGIISEEGIIRAPYLTQLLRLKK